MKTRRRQIRPRVYSPLSFYLREITRTPLLDADDERRVACQIGEGNQEAREIMVRANLRLVVCIARSYSGKGIDFQDLIAEGNLGLLRAVELYDPAMNTRFATYAAYWIRQSIRLAVATKANTIRIPTYLIQLLSRWHRASRVLQEHLGRTPTHEELAGHLNMSQKRLKKLKKILQMESVSARGYYTCIRFQDNDPVEDRRSRAPDLEMSEAEDRRKVFWLLQKLDNRDAIVLRMRFGLLDDAPMAFGMIGKHLGLTRDRVRQIVRDALNKLRREMETGVIHAIE